MEFLLPSRRRFSLRNVPSGEERGETDVFAGYQCGPGSNPSFKSQFRRHMWVEFVVGSLLCPERFFSGYSRFPNSNSTRNQVDEEPHCGCATSKSLFFYLFYLFKGRLARVALKQRPYKTHCFSSVLRYPTGLYCHKPKNLWTISQNNFPRT